MQCVVCGTNFGSEYDPEIKAYPVYHPPSSKKYEICEKIFYKTLLRLHVFLFDQEHSIPATQLLHDFDWKNDILMRKEMISWCLAKGFLTVDSFKRIEVPYSIRSEFGEFLQAIDPTQPGVLDRFFEEYRDHLRAVYPSLKPVSPDQMPFKFVELKLGQSTLFDNIDTTQIELRGKKSDSDSAEERRLSSLRQSMERKLSR
ncbi:MAG: hypothetical protein C4527_10300 [Candidatus Omnitrophota bacterium]|nr:MAG: hypothetical protein C4527_10300 [Candidatus Omnitrophota bacterium]